MGDTVPRWYRCPECGRTVYSIGEVEECVDHKPTMPEDRGSRGDSGRVSR